MRGGTWAYLTAATGLLLFTGCPPTYPKCDNDDNCKDHNEVCVQGQCQECATDQNCKAGFVCQANKCVPKPECTADANCPNGGKCEAGKCVAQACQQDSDCASGRCKNNVCVTNSCTSADDCRTGEDCSGGVCTAKAGAGDACNWNAIRFGFNDSGLNDDSRTQLNGLSDCMKKGDVKKVTLEGNADERGTEEYNLQLSNRRAAAVKKYLVDLGVGPAKLETIGYGENRPVADGHDEAAWAANRRVELKH